MSDIDLSAANKITITKNDDGRTFAVEADVSCVENGTPIANRHYIFPRTTVSVQIVVVQNEEGNA